MKKKKVKTPLKRWIVAKSIYNNTDYEVWEIFSTEEECKEYISNNIPQCTEKISFILEK